MLTFFRRIRKGLLGTGATSKYMLYVVGEIALVVIGILIALQINNWNEGRKSDKQIQLFLSNLVEAIYQDLDYLNSTASTHEFRFNSLQYMLEITGSTPMNMEPLPKREEMTIWKESYPDTMNRNFIELILRYSGENPIIVINRNVVDEMKNVGLFSAIKNESLKKAINRYYSYVEARFQQEDWNERLIVTWREFLRDNYGVLVIEKYSMGDLVELVRSNESVQIRMKELIGPAKYRSNNASIAISLAKDVLEMINNELKIPAPQ